MKRGTKIAIAVVACFAIWFVFAIANAAAGNKHGGIYIEYRSRLIELMEKWSTLWKEFENLRKNGNSSDQNYYVLRTVVFLIKTGGISMGKMDA